jgi:CCR4-NOT transcription complex subunit 4
MSDVERIFDRFIDAFADDLLEIARAYIDVEMGRALAVAERSNSKQTKAQLRAQKKAQRLAAKAQLKADKQRKREEKRAARLAEKARIKAEQAAERETRQAEHDRLKQQRMALKQELEAERRRLREATRKRPVRQLPLDFDGLRAPKSRRGVPAANSPPQLFVHKRKRDGQIEKLARNDGPAAPANGTAPVTNGAAAPSVPEAPPPAE